MVEAQRELQHNKMTSHRYYPWLVWAVTVSFVLFQFFLQVSSGVMADGLMHDFSINVMGMGTLTAVFFYVYAAMQIPVGLFFDHFPIRKVLTISTSICALGCFTFALAGTITIAELARILMGAGAAFGFVGMMYTVSVLFPAKQFAFVIGLAEMVGMLGAGGGETIFAEVVARVGWRDAMFGCGVIASIIALLMWLIIRDDIKKQVVHAEEKLSVGVALKHVMSKGQAWLNATYNGMMFITVTVFAALWSVPYLKLAYPRHSETQIALLNSMIFFGIAVGSPFAGWLSTKIGRRKPPLIVGVFSSIIVFCFIIFSSHVPFAWAGVLYFLLGLFCSVYILNFAIASELFASNVRATAIGFTNMICMIWAPILQPMTAYLLHLKASRTAVMGGLIQYTIYEYQWALLIIPACFLVGLFCIMLLKETYCKPSSAS